MLKKTLFVILLCITSQSFSQENYAMTFGYYHPVIADTAEYYNNLSVECYVVNTGTDTIFSQIRTMILTNPGVGEESVRELFSVSFENGSGLNPGDSVYFPAPPVDSPNNGSFDVVLPTNNYIDGDNIIVVWPVIDGTTSFTSEQYSKEIYVNEPTSIDKNPISDIKILVSNSLIEVSSINDVDRVQLFNLEGRVVAESQTNKILKSSLKSGIYILKVVQKGKLISRTVFLD
jgi:hypothetical protein